MSRLTKRINAEISKGLTYEAIIYKDIEHHETDFNYKALEKLAHYEDLEEQGRLIELPCAVGDTVWEIDEYAEGFKARPMTVLSIKLKENKGFVYTAYSDEHDNFVRGYGFDDFGEILFLSKEEAERKLAELEGDNK